MHAITYTNQEWCITCYHKSATSISMYTITRALLLGDAKSTYVASCGKCLYSLEVTRCGHARLVATIDHKPKVLYTRQMLTALCGELECVFLSIDGSGQQIYLHLYGTNRHV